MSGPCTDPTSNKIWGILNQRRKYNSWAIAPTRLTINSPYPNNTQMQLDMRRKVEILKYQTQNSQVNNLTRAQKWSQMVSGNYSGISQHTVDNNSDNLKCASDNLIPTLTSACDVPGPPMYLTYDPLVPLYNYNIVRNYATAPIAPRVNFNIYTQNEILFLESTTLSISTAHIKTRELTLGSIIINNTSNTQTAFKFSSPIAIWCAGILIGTDYNSETKTYGTQRPTITNIDISITSIYLNIYYNNNRINQISITGNTYSNLTINPNLTALQVFYAIQYAGLVNMEFSLDSIAAGSVYDLTLSVNYNYNDDATRLNAFEAGIFCNLTSTNQNVYANPVPNVLTGSQISAVVSSPSTTPFTSSFINYTDLVNSLPI